MLHAKQECSELVGASCISHAMVPQAAVAAQLMDRLAFTWDSVQLLLISRAKFAILLPTTTLTASFAGVLETQPNCYGPVHFLRGVHDDRHI